MYTRKLIDPKTDKVWIATLSDKTLKLETGKDGATKVKEKICDSSSVTQDQLEKQEWEMLKKGYILRNPDSPGGEPTLHYYIGRGYTGCLVVANTRNEIVTNKNGDFNNNENDALVFITQEGVLTNSIKLPQFLPWDAVYSPVNNSLFIDIDHLIFQYNMETGNYIQLTSKCEEPASFISVEGSRAVYCTHPRMIAKDIKTDKILFSHDINCELYGGHTPQICGTLSKDERILALCVKLGEIQLFNAETGALIDSIHTESERISKMEFADSDNILVTLGNSGIRLFDVKRKEELPSLGLGEVHTFCFNPNQDKLAVLIRKGEVRVFDFVRRVHLYSFRVEHMVKTGQIAFVNEKLAIRTDYGCLSLYSV